MRPTKPTLAEFSLTINSLKLGPLSIDWLGIALCERGILRHPWPTEIPPPFHLIYCMAPRKLLNSVENKINLANGLNKSSIRFTVNDKLKVSRQEPLSPLHCSYAVANATQRADAGLAGHP